MYNKFCVTALDFSALNKTVSIVFNKDIDEDTIIGGAVKLSSIDGKALSFKTEVVDEEIVLYLDNWPDTSSEYNLVIDKSVSDIAGNTLTSIFRKKIKFPEEITAVTTIKYPYNFQKLDVLELSLSNTDSISEYYVEIADNNNFYDCIYESEIYTDRLMLDIPAMKAGQYYIRARRQENGNYGPWSKIVTFIYKYVCDDDEPKPDGPSADAQMPSAWDNLFSNEEEKNTAPIVDIEDELEVITHPESGETPTSFLFEFDKELDPYLGDIVVIKKEF